MKHIIITIIILSLSSIAAGAPGDKARKRVISDLNSSQKMANYMHGYVYNDCYTNKKKAEQTQRSMKYKLQRALNIYAANCIYSSNFFRNTSLAVDGVEKACAPINCAGHDRGRCHGNVAGNIKSRISKARKRMFSCYQDFDPRTGRRIK